MLLKKGDTGINVTFLQYGLHIMCCTPNGFDGTFGTGTENAVIKYQNKMGLSADGVAGDGTWNNLKGEISIIQRALKSKGYYSSYIDGIANADGNISVVIIGRWSACIFLIICMIYGIYAERKSHKVSISSSLKKLTILRW